MITTLKKIKQGIPREEEGRDTEKKTENFSRTEQINQSRDPQEAHHNRL